MGLQVGAARVVITPPLGCGLQGALTARYATNVHDDLFAQAIVIDDGERRVGIVVCDLITANAEFVEPAKAIVAERCGIPPERLLVSGTHTHTGPVTMNIAEYGPDPDYLASLATKIADAVQLAVNRLQPAQFGFATGDCTGVVFNRRYHLKDGSVVFNPGYLNPQIDHVAGPTDPKLSVLVFRTPDRQPIAVLANLSLHYVGGGHLDISADYFGYFSRALQRCAGSEFVAVLSNGCQGDINNCDFMRPAPQQPYLYFHTERVANVVAGEAWKVWNGLWEEDFRDDLTVDGALEMVPLTPRRLTAEQIAAAKEYLQQPNPEADPWKWCYANEHVAMEHDWPEQRIFPIQALRLGDIGLVGLPAEPFCEIGLDLRQRSPLPHVVPIGLANDCAGYVATDRHLDLGGYEVTLCRWVYSPKGTAETWVSTACRLLDSLTTP